MLEPRRTRTYFLEALLERDPEKSRKLWAQAKKDDDEQRAIFEGMVRSMSKALRTVIGDDPK